MREARRQPMKTITKIRTVDELIGCHSEKMCRDHKYLELANGFHLHGIWWVNDAGELGEPEQSGFRPNAFLFIPKPVVQRYQIDEGVTEDSSQLQLL